MLHRRSGCAGGAGVGVGSAGRGGGGELASAWLIAPLLCHLHLHFSLLNWPLMAIRVHSTDLAVTATEITTTTTSTTNYDDEHSLHQWQQCKLFLSLVLHWLQALGYGSEATD